MGAVLLLVGLVAAAISSPLLDRVFTNHLALFGKLVRKLSKKLTEIHKAAIGATIAGGPSTETLIDATGDVTGKDGAAATQWKPVQANLEQELKEAGDEATKALREKQRQMIDSLDLSK